MKHNYNNTISFQLKKLGVGDINGGKPSNLSKLDGDLDAIGKLVKQITTEQEAAEEERVANDPKNVLNQKEADTWKVRQSKPLKVKNVKRAITDNSISELSRPSKSFDSVNHI